MDRSKKDGLTCYCKTCQSSQVRRLTPKKYSTRSRKPGSVHVCTKCGESDPTKFYSAGKSPLACICKKCSIAQKVQWQTTHKEEYQQRQKRWRDANPGYRNRRVYGLSPEEYQAMFDSQFGFCAICGTAPKDGKFHVDHCHTSGVVRGLLCSHCNQMLGMAKDNPETLMKAAAYLRLHLT